VDEDARATKCRGVAGGGMEDAQEVARATKEAEMCARTFLAKLLSIPNDRDDCGYCCGGGKDISSHRLPS